MDGIRKKLVPNSFLYLIMSKNSILSPSAKIKICTLSKAPPPVWPCYQHTHKTSIKTLRMNLSWGHFNSSLQAQTHICPQNSNFFYNNWRAENQSGLTHKCWVSLPKYGNTLKMYFRSCWTFRNFEISDHMLIWYVCFLLYFCTIHAISSTWFLGWSTLVLGPSINTSWKAEMQGFNSWELISRNLEGKSKENAQYYSYNQVLW